MNGSKLFALSLLLCAPIFTAAKPVSFPGASTVIAQADPLRSGVRYAYSPSARYAVGVRLDQTNFNDDAAVYATYDRLLKRWNGGGWQANTYLELGLGGVDGPGDHAAAYAGASADWEDRRWLIAWRGLLERRGDDDRARQMARLGWAPVERPFDAVQPWLIAELRHEPEADDALAPFAVVRLFTGRWLAELGGGPTGVLASLEIRFF